MGFNRFDLQGGAQYAYNLHQFQIQGAFDIGINRTLFQQRFFPKLSLGSAYDLLKTENFFLGPQVTMSGYTLNYNLNVNRPTFWLDLMPGIHFEYGKKWKAVFSAWMGPAWQWDHIPTQGRYIPTFFVNFESSIGCAYAF